MWWRLLRLIDCFVVKSREKILKNYGVHKSYLIVYIKYILLVKIGLAIITSREVNNISFSIVCEDLDSLIDCKYMY